jgi:hypothetical protein
MCIGTNMNAVTDLEENALPFLDYVERIETELRGTEQQSSIPSCLAHTSPPSA